MPQRIPLPTVPKALIEAGYEPASYRRLYTGCLDGTVPAQRSAAGRWSVALDDLPAVADALGLMEAHAA